MPHLFESLHLRGTTLANRIAVSPMCQYSAVDGMANDWHLVHLASRAIGGAGLVIFEASAVSATGRISPADLGIWNDEQAAALARIVRVLKQHGSAAGIQLAHAGRKGSTAPPWQTPGGAIAIDKGGWQPAAPSALRFADHYPLPQALDEAGMVQIVGQFAAAARRALAAGFDVIEVHAAHGYLLHQFLSPISNQREDRYGGSFENRIRFPLEVVTAVRDTLPEHVPLLVRVSATDWVEGGWNIDETVELSRLLGQAGVDLIDTSSGGSVLRAEIPVGPGYQTSFAARIRRETGVATGAVGNITVAEQADHIIRSGQADLVLLAREVLRDPYWPLQAAQALGHAISWPKQYLRAAPPGSPERISRGV